MVACALTHIPRSQCSGRDSSHIAISVSTLMKVGRTFISDTTFPFSSSCRGAYHILLRPSAEFVCVGLKEYPTRQQTAPVSSSREGGHSECHLHREPLSNAPPGSKHSSTHGRSRSCLRNVLSVFFLVNCSSAQQELGTQLLSRGRASESARRVCGPRDFGGRCAHVIFDESQQDSPQRVHRFFHAARRFCRHPHGFLLLGDGCRPQRLRLL